MSDFEKHSAGAITRKAILVDSVARLISSGFTADTEAGLEDEYYSDDSDLECIDRSYEADEEDDSSSDEDRPHPTFSASFLSAPGWPQPQPTVASPAAKVSDWLVVSTLTLNGTCLLQGYINKLLISVT